MAKLVSSFKNMALSLTVITLVAAAALAGVFLLTEARIEQQKRDAETAAQQSVLNGNAEGTAIKVAVDGFGGKMIVMVGFAPDGTMLGYKILEHQETPGLGANVCERKFPRTIFNLRADAPDVPENRMLGNGLRIFNPGSIALPKGGFPPTFGFFDGAELSIFRLDDGSRLG